VRELETALVRFLVMGDAATGNLGDLLGSLQPIPIFNESALAGKSLSELHRELDRVYLTRLFKESKGDLGRIAETLGMKISNVYHWLKRSGIRIRDLRRKGMGPGPP